MCNYSDPSGIAFSDQPVSGRDMKRYDSSPLPTKGVSTVTMDSGLLRTDRRAGDPSPLPTKGVSTVTMDSGLLRRAGDPSPLPTKGQGSLHSHDGFRFVP